MKRSREPEEDPSDPPSPVSATTYSSGIVTGVNSPPAENEGDRESSQQPAAKFTELNPAAAESTFDMRCSLPPHRDPVKFASYDEFEAHYHKTHTNRCLECRKNLPSAHLLSLAGDGESPIRDTSAGLRARPVADSGEGTGAGTSSHHCLRPDSRHPLNSIEASVLFPSTLPRPPSLGLVPAAPRAHVAGCDAKDIPKILASTALSLASGQTLTDVLASQNDSLSVLNSFLTDEQAFIETLSSTPDITVLAPSNGPDMCLAWKLR